MRRLILVMLVLLTGALVFVSAQTTPTYSPMGTVAVAPATAKLTAIDPLVYADQSEVIPPRPFLYTVDANGITVTRFNDNKVVGTWPWPRPPELLYTVLPDGSFTGLNPPAAWEPVAMVVSYPTTTEWANRGMTGTTVLKPIPDLTPPPTFVYVVMAHSGYAWNSTTGLRDTIVPASDPANDSSMLIQIDVSDPSFSAAGDPSAPVTPHVAGALLGRGAGQPVYDPATGNVYVGNMPSPSLPADLSSFVSVVRRIPAEVAEVEAEVPGISIPVIRCGPQHPESGIPVGRPQAWACYDPGGVHPINDNEHVGAAGNYEWEFRNLPSWVTAHTDKATGKLDGILYGTPPAVGEWYAEARVHDLDDPYGVFSFWTPIQLLVNPTAEYLPIRAEFAAGVPVAYPLEGTGACALSGAPAWVDVATVPNGCVVMGRAPLDGEHYSFTMPGFSVAGYPALSLVFSGNVFGEYAFDPLPAGVAISGLAWHQISKVADPSTEAAVLTAEFVGVAPSGQLYRILPPPGKPQPPNERPPETALTLDVITAEGTPLTGSGFGNVAVEADRDIYVAASGAVIRVSGGVATAIPLPVGMQASSLSLDSDLRTAIPLVEPGQVDHGALWVAGGGNVAVVDTHAATVVQSFPVSGAASVSADFGTRYAYAADGTSVQIFGPAGSVRPPMVPRIWSAEEFTWILGQPGEVHLMATGDGVPTLSMMGTLPPGLLYTPHADGTATISGTPTAPGAGGGGELDVEGGDYAMVITATGSAGTYAQNFGISVQSPPTITSPNAATFYAGSANSFTVTGIGWPTPIFFTWDSSLLPPGVQLIDNENGTSSLIGTPATAGTYTFSIFATTGAPPDAEQVFTLTVLPAASVPPTITSASTFTWDAAGAPYSPDPFTVTSIGAPTPALTVTGTLPPGVTFIDNHDSTATLGGACRVVWPGWPAECLGFLPANAVGTYTFTITASNAAGATSQTFTLVVGTDATLLGAEPATLSFTTDGTYVPTAPLSLTTGGDVLPYGLVTTVPWLKVTPVSGMLPAGVTVSADAAGLAPGSYTGTIIVGSAGTEGPFATVAVTMTVIGMAAPGTVGAWPNSLRFDYHVGDATPLPQMVWVMSGGETLNYTLSSPAKWLFAPPGGTAPGGFSVSVDPKVGIGMHITTLTIDGAGATNGPQTMPVTLVKTAGVSDLAQVMFDVGGAPEGIAVNRTTHNLFITSSNVAAEAGGEAGSEAGPEVEAPGPPEPSSVFHIDPVGKSVLGTIVVHSEGEYVAVNSKTGIAYHASQGAGEVAVMDGATNKVLTFIPLTRDEGVYQPYQIAVDEKQNIIYVGAHAPAIPDPGNTSPFPCKAIHEMPDDEYDCWNPGRVFVIDGRKNTVVGSFLAGDDPEGVVFAAATNKVYASNEDDGSITVAKGAVRNANGTITPASVVSTIIRGKAVPGWWQPTCDANNLCGERGQAALWPQRSACNGIDDEAEEADKMAVDSLGNVYIIDDRYRVAKINAKTDSVAAVLAIPGYACEAEVPDGSLVTFPNTANNIAFMTVGKSGKLYVTSEQNTVTLIDPATMTIKSTLTIPGAVELDAITTDPGLNQVYITDEGSAVLWILKGACANGTGRACVIR